jgi:hypothetical protein
MPSLVQRYLGNFLALYLGCAGCYLLRTDFGWSSILSASVLEVAISFVPFPARFDRKGIQIAFCTGTFVGMSSLQIIANPLQALEISLLGAALYVLAGPHLTGLGGRMGFIAFLATTTWLLLRAFA